MKKITISTCIIIAAAAPFVLAFQQPEPPLDLDKLRTKPIAKGGGKVGELLRQWWNDGTAAGNAGDCYDNRDADHSPLNLDPYPQLTPIKYKPEDTKLGKHWAGQSVIIPHVTFGNSSTSAPAHLGGSNPRSYYVSPQGLAFLYFEYTKNNLYIYPKHRDYDVGHNGAFFLPSGARDEGYGDMYPTNTPYLIISLGSSLSDQPFMRMMPSVLAAFRPEVKKKLTETGTLMPTIQMLLRSTNKHLKDPKEYLTGKAHPTVFEGSWVDELTMVQKAHALELKSLPPIVKLHVVEEDKAIPGIDFFDLYTERLSDSPSCIARIHRRKAQKYRLVVSAAKSFDHNDSKLTYTWVVLRGNPDKIKIVPKKEDSSVAEITVAWHERRPIAPGSPLESNRVDIGVFVHNGTYYSPPAFVTVCTLDCESRTYSESGKLLDIAHGMGETEVRGTDWEKVFRQIAKDNAVARMLGINEAQQAWFPDAARFHQAMYLDLREGQTQVKIAELDLKAAKSDAEREVAKKALEKGRRIVANTQIEINTEVDRPQKTLDDRPRHFVLSRFAKLTQDPLFTEKHQEWLKQMRTPANEAKIKAHWQKLAHFGIATPKEALAPLVPGKTLADAKWTKFELAQLEAFHAALLADLAFPGAMQVEYRSNFVDQRLSVPRVWRDVHRYDPNGEWIGWMRYSSDGLQLFNHEGLLAVGTDFQLRCVKGREVRYGQDQSKNPGFNTNPLRMALGDKIVHYEFTGKDDWRGRRTATETVKDEKK
jgi:hypothetical protein